MVCKSVNTRYGRDVTTQCSASTAQAANKITKRTFEKFMHGLVSRDYVIPAVPVSLNIPVPFRCHCLTVFDGSLTVPVSLYLSLSLQLSLSLSNYPCMSATVPVFLQLSLYLCNCPCISATVPVFLQLSLYLSSCPCRCNCSCRCNCPCLSLIVPVSL